ncbi:ABC-type sugar transport system, periplasmic component [Sphaerochaeta pleomorpha str. Grapes]|uniref:ABC-type sugar transport system, periplasmic component n=1 Tax=Sphaerochaeta pleomorpha (strain ATCC BAA-1885 / DSM 22778 / Grapes) TaxID=158190 RepID=G8QVM9_SPHPG|nr:extracellular solute-binding protein [Sphaerochaeta pleomorpha]AEV29321.1 ABC-type sugar transport system, periplasmic component [Sphaerochaeta pleomorpha str. Grapes]
MRKTVKIALTALLLMSFCAGNIFAGGAKEETSTQEQKKIVYWSMWNQTEPQGMVIEEAIKDFEVKNPGVKVEINWCGREIRKTLQPALDNGQAIDLWDEDTERVVKTWGDYAISLDDYVTKAWPGTDGKPYEDAVMKSLLTQARAYSKDGKTLMAVTYQPFVFAFMYNKDHFAKAGITTAPQTWAEFTEACAKLKKAGFVPLTTDDAYVDTLMGYYLARAKGYQWVQALVTDKTGAMWDDPVVLQMAKAFEDLAKKGYFSETVGANKWPSGQQDIANGTVSMYLNGTWLVNEIMGTTGPDFPWGTFSFPTVPNGTDNITCANYGGQAFQISKNSKYPDVVFALITHLTTGEWDKQLAQQSYGVPVGGTTDWPVQLSEAKDLFTNLTTCYPWAAGIETETNKTPLIIEAFTKLISGQYTAEQFVTAVKK